MRLCTVKLNGSMEAAVGLDKGLLTMGYLNESEGTAFPGELRSLIASEMIGSLEELIRKRNPQPNLTEEEAVFAPPYREPPKIWGIGLNYREHARDLHAPEPDEPASFMKPSTTVIGHLDRILLPPQSRRVTAEAELAVIIGRECRDLRDEKEAREAVFGYTVAIDMTAEDILQRNPRYLTRSKSFDTFFSFGPWVVTAGEVEDIGSTDITTILNGEPQRSGKISGMFFSPFYLVLFHSRVMTLKPGDIISTGTPGASVIKEGDVVEGVVEGVGRLKNCVGKRARPGRYY